MESRTGVEAVRDELYTGYYPRAGGSGNIPVPTAYRTTSEVQVSSPEYAQNERSYGCSYGCGNPYDTIIINVRDGTTEFLCLPCFVRLASDVVAAMTEADNPDVQAAMAYAAGRPADLVPGPTGKRRGHNAPATADDPDLLAEFDSVITVDDLPDEFR